MSCPATTQPSRELSVKLWPSSALLWRLSSAIRGLGKEERKRQLVFVEAKLCLSYCWCQLHDPVSGYGLLIVVQLGGPRGIQLELAFIAIEVLPESYVKDNGLMQGRLPARSRKLGLWLANLSRTTSTNAYLFASKQKHVLVNTVGTSGLRIGQVSSS